MARKSALPETSIERAVSRLRALLHAKSQNMSAVREHIVRGVLAYKGHFSVDDLLRFLRESGLDQVHMATLYRTIPLLVEAGMIQPAFVSKGDKQRYEVRFEKEHHNHLLCSSCGTIVEFQSEALFALQKKIAKRYGFVLDDHVVELRGRCSSCRQAE